MAPVLKVTYSYFTINFLGSSYFHSSPASVGREVWSFVMAKVHIKLCQDSVITSNTWSSQTMIKLHDWNGGSFPPGKSKTHWGVAAGKYVLEDFLSHCSPTHLSLLKKDLMRENLKYFLDSGQHRLVWYCFSEVSWHCGSLNKYKVIHNQAGKKEMTSVLTVLKILWGIFRIFLSRISLTCNRI